MRRTMRHKLFSKTWPARLAREPRASDRREELAAVEKALGRLPGKRTVWPVLVMAGMLGAVFHPAESLASYEEVLSEEVVSGHFSGQLPQAQEVAASPAFVTGSTANVSDNGFGNVPVRNRTGGLAHRGRRGAEPVLESRGSGIALAHALPLLAPEGWSVSGAHRARDTPVSWDAGTGWLATLERLARETGTVLVVDWENACLLVGEQDDLQADAPATAKVPSAAAGREPETDTASSLVVSHHGGYGRVYLARPMTAERAAAIFDVRLADLLAWNGIASKSETLPEGRALWLRDPKTLDRSGQAGPAANATASAGATGALTADAAPGRSAPAKTLAGRADGKVRKDPNAPAAPAADARAKSQPAQGLETDRAKEHAKGQAKEQAKEHADVARALAQARNETGTGDGARTANRSGDTNAAFAGAPGSGNLSGNMAENPSGSVPHAANGASTAAWTLAPGSLHDQVASWAAQAGWKLVWQADTDLAMEAGAGFAGTFPEVVRALFEGLHENGAPYRARLFHGNRVLQVEDR